MRCYGESDCRGGTEPGWVTLSRDMQAAINFLRDKGFKHIVCAGASMGGRACVTVAFDEELAGLISVSGTASDDPEKKDLNNMVNPGMPKLFVVSESDPTVNRVDDMTRLYESAPDPKEFHAFPGTAHGTEFFKTQYGGALRRRKKNPPQAPWLGEQAIAFQIDNAKRYTRAPHGRPRLPHKPGKTNAS